MKKNDIVELEITGMSAQGLGVGKADGMAVFVAGAAPGDLLSVIIVKILKNYCFGKLTRIITPSKYRVVPDCGAFLRCGGCVYRHISIDAEAKIKFERARDALTRIGGIDTEILPIISDGVRNGYRNKAQYPVGTDKNGGIIYGFYSLHSHNIVQSDECPLSCQEFSRIAKKMVDFAERFGWTAYDERRHSGLLRHIYIRKAAATGELMLCLVVNGGALPREREWADAMRAEFEQIKTIVINDNSQQTNVILGKSNRTIFGSGYITDELCGLKFKLSANTFYQVNSGMTRRLYETAISFARPDGCDILDLYCGAGTIGLIMAKRAKSVTGVEIVPDAVADAKFNAAQNGIENARFLCADAATAAGMIKRRPNVVILDPPRRGVDERLIGIVAREFAPDRVVYISCDAATLARDLQRFEQAGYITKKVQPIDMFPATPHVECAALLTKRRK